MPKVNPPHIADVCAGLINGRLLRACTTRHRWSLFLLWHERRSLMAAIRTPGITIAADGNYSIDAHIGDLAIQVLDLWRAGRIRTDDPLVSQAVRASRARRVAAGM